MNGVHDMGGMQGFGPVMPEADEPWFHEPWERRVFALTLAMGATGAWNLDQSRTARESLPPARYLASSYYRIWLEGVRKLLLARGLVTEAELADGHAHAAPAALARVLMEDEVAAVLARGSPTLRAANAPARLRVGDAVRTRNLNPPSHTRLPRYCRDKPGTVIRVHGAHVFADAHAHGREDPQWLYTVRFDAKDLWGPDTTADAVSVDCWEPYLEPV
ncbi:MAG: nitrile hydratase subunit beta [Burkholderiales bacterium]|nr:nitrile hydratase subunit beta [Burkholderiales bacterium]